VQRGVELGVLAVDGYGDMLPERKVGGSAVVEELEEMLDGSGVGQLDGVAIAVEEFLQEAEVEDVDSHFTILPKASPCASPSHLRVISLYPVGPYSSGVNRPTVSVVIPVFNAERHLREAIESVLNQTILPDEMVVVDDGSTDESLRIVAEYGSRVTIRRQANLGASAARNLGATTSRCHWIAYLDADDYWFPDKLEKQLALIASDPAVDVVYSGKRDLFEDGKFEDIPAVDPSILPKMLTLMNWIHPTTALVRREVAVAHPWPAHLKSSVDWFFFYSLLKVARFAAVAEPTAIYRRHHDSLTHRNWRSVMRNAQMVADMIRGDFHGWERMILHWQVSSRILANAAIAARDSGSPEYLGLIARSIVMWPLPNPVHLGRHKLFVKMFQQTATRWVANGATAMFLS
jgi:glycosyltransferase involved in cell wall biosynthesis